MADALFDLRKLIAELPKDVPGSSVDLLLGQMETASSRVLRLCAIPHQFTPSIIQVLVPDLDAPQAELYYEAYSRLPMVLLRENDRAIHDEARAYLFHGWLKKENELEFVAASTRLAGYFRDRFESEQGEQRENLERQYMFHLFAADRAAGFREFERIWSEQYRQFRLGGCESMVKLLWEYGPILAADYRAWLTYFEAMLTTDLFNIPEAERKFKAILNDPVASQDIDLRIRTLVRLGQVSSKKSDWRAAIGYLQKALQAEGSAQGAGKAYRIQHDLGVANRELGELDAAAEFFQDSLRGAGEAGDASALATSYNGQGTLYLKMNDLPRAVDSYEKALERLREAGDRFRFAQIYNNLGMVHARTGDLAKSRQYYEESLKIKEEAGDTLGQAMTLNNLVPIYRSQGEIDRSVTVARHASELFLRIRDTYNAALAKGNLGRLYRKIGDLESANKALSESEELFRKCGKLDQAAEIRKLIATPTGRRFRWWVWLAGLITLLLATVLIIAALG
jgi:tetratricopeptide (TPR) repeat protein